MHSRFKYVSNIRLGESVVLIWPFQTVFPQGKCSTLFLTATFVQKDPQVFSRLLPGSKTARQFLSLLVISKISVTDRKGRVRPKAFPLLPDTKYCYWFKLINRPGSAGGLQFPQGHKEDEGYRCTFAKQSIILQAYSVHVLWGKEPQINRFALKGYRGDFLFLLVCNLYVD